MGEYDRRCCTCCPRRSPGNHSKRVPIPTLLFLLISAVPISIIVSLERSAVGFTYQTCGWIRECAKWDPEARRFLASTFFSGGIVQLTSGDPDAAAGVLTERAVLTDPDVARNASLGIYVDRHRRRLLVVYSDLWGFRYGAFAAYELGSWSRLFLTTLSGPATDKKKKSRTISSRERKRLNSLKCILL